MVTSVSSTTPSTAGTGTTTSSTSSATSGTANSSTSGTNTSAKAAAQSLITSLGTGSGVDVNSLANALANAEIAPQKAGVQSQIDKSNATISGYAAIKYVLGNLQKAFGDLKDKSDFGSMTASNSQPDAFSVTTSSNADIGSHTITIDQVASAQRSLSAGSFASTTDPLNQGQG